MKGYLLFQDIKEADFGFADLLLAAQYLTPFATQFRYPDDFEITDPLREEFEEAIENAEQIYQFVLSKLPKETHP